MKSAGTTFKTPCHAGKAINKALDDRRKLDPEHPPLTRGRPYFPFRNRGRSETPQLTRGRRQSH